MIDVNDGVKHQVERIDDLMNDGLKIIQRNDVFSFGMDAVLLAHFVRLHRGDRVIDLGTGTGVIPLLLTARMQDLTIEALEIQPILAELAQRSVAMNHLGDNIHVSIGDLRQVETYYKYESFDVVTCNPPYMAVITGPSSPLNTRAIARHELKCNLEDVIIACKKLIRFGGYAAFVYRTERLDELLILLSRYGLQPKRMRLIQSRIDKAPELFLLEAKKGASKGLKMLPTLIVYDEEGGYTPELMSIYFPEA